MSIDTLHGLTHEDLQHELGIVAQLKMDADGISKTTDLGANLNEGDGVRYQAGVLQLGLTRDEIEDVSGRLEDLIGNIDEGDSAVF